MEVVTNTMKAIKMIHAKAQRASPAHLVPPPLLSLQDEGDGETPRASTCTPPAPRSHPTGSAATLACPVLGSKVGNNPRI